VNPFRYSLNRKRFTRQASISQGTAQCLGMYVVPANSSLVRSLLKGTHMRLHNLLIADHHDRSDLFRRTLRFQRRD